MRGRLVSFITLCLTINFPLLATERLVVAGGSLTEIVYALGAEDQLVGVDSSSIYPFSATQLPNIGYYRTLNVEGVLSVEPSKIILLSGAGPENVVKQLSRLNTEIVMVDNPKTVAGLIKTIDIIAKETGTETAGKKLIEKIKKEIESLSSMPKLTGKSAAFLMSAGERGLIAAGAETTPSLIFDSLNISNPFSELKGFKPVSAEALAKNAPDIILIASHTTQEQNIESLCKTAQLKLWSSIKGCNLVKIDSLKYLGLTPRLPQAIAETRELF
ncbi:ABC transporter substrate-binding protein [Alteromonas sp. 5E99-2]|uniref:heme/hemin ABC transporter substrate-binding protein n=1 Tax=Alteromonas sp. 5E99-2 TaxID=2817683 RepID=UPI001A9951BB|nr:ABC transporter substrate-binding protein [Alteromonas sp. 5E99-2]MBO1255367.1 ABC transporter substrate-binding protein [Alteromonas sp. 5E99-2]